MIEPRKKWLKNWDEIKYCSDRCRQNKVRDDYEEQLLAALAKLPRGGLLDPADLLTSNADAATLEKVRSAARRLHAKGLIAVLQKSREVEPSTARGPFHIRLLKSN